MKRLTVAIGVLVAGAFLMGFLQGCGNSERSVGPSKNQESALLETSVDREREIHDDGSILITVLKTGEAKEIHDQWILRVIISVLPEDSWARLFADGVVYVYDVEIAGAVVATAGMESFEVSEGIVLYFWSCILSCYSDNVLCSPCPQCCEKKDDDKDKYYPFKTALWSN